MTEPAPDLVIDARPYNGLLFIGDPHVCASPPGFRLDDYRQTVLDKLSFCLELARTRGCLPIILGDLFHIPRDNPNSLLVALTAPRPKGAEGVICQLIPGSPESHPESAAGTE